MRACYNCRYKQNDVSFHILVVHIPGGFQVVGPEYETVC